MEYLITYFEGALNYLTSLVGEVRYLGIFIGMFLESTFVPLPSEIIMIPAGISAASGEVSLYLAIIAGVMGNLCGALFNYFLSFYLGSAAMYKVGKYFFVKEHTIDKIKEFFNKHGAISIFIGRLIPGVRHYISIPAGLTRMNLAAFCIFSFAGSLVWVTTLTYLGFILGGKRELIKQSLHLIIAICLLFCAAIVIIYMIYNNFKSSRLNPKKGPKDKA